MASRKVFSTLLRSSLRRSSSKPSLITPRAPSPSPTTRASPAACFLLNREYAAASAAAVAAPETTPSSSPSSKGSGGPSGKITDEFTVCKSSSRHDMVIVFTCTVCETRSMKTACKESYEKGVVVVRCGGCSNLHLIADRLGWFGEPGSVEELLAARGEEIKKGSVDSLSLSPQDLAGLKSIA